VGGFDDLGEHHRDLGDRKRRHRIDFRGASSTVLTTNSTGTFWQKLATSQLTNDSGFLSSYTETDPVVKAINGIVKSNGSTISAAANGTDYTLITAKTCTAGYHASAITAAAW